MAAVGAGYHEAFGARSWPAAACRPLTLGRRTGPSWSTRRSCARSAGIPWAHGSARSSEAASASRDPGTRSSAWSPIWTPGERGGAAYIYRAASAAELDPVVVTVRVAGDASPLAPRVAALARQVDAGLQLRDIATLDEVVAQEREIEGIRQRRLRQHSGRGGGLLRCRSVRAHGRRRGASHPRDRDPYRTRRHPPARAPQRFRPCRSSARRRHHRRQQPHPVPRVAHRQPDRGSPRLVGDHVRHHGGVGVLACAAPARRALRVQPTEALRQV